MDIDADSAVADDALACAEPRETALPVGVADCMGVVVSEVVGSAETDGVDTTVGCEAEGVGEDTGRRD